MVEDGRKALQKESCLKWSALPWVIANPFAGGGPTEAALPPERRGGHVFGRWGSSKNSGIWCQVGPRLRFQLCLGKTWGNFSWTLNFLICAMDIIVSTPLDYYASK